MSPKRVHYREYQTLTHGELSDEQRYRIGMRRRHNIAHHGWGIVQGLVLQPTRNGVGLSAGLAIDGYGRELVVARRLELRQPVLEGVLQGQTVGTVDVWLTYHVVSSGSSQEPCYEDAWLRLDCADPLQPVEPQYPAEVSPADLDFGPDREPPDDASLEWPVYLGRIAVGVGDPSLPPYSRNILPLAERVYATLVGARLQTPAGFPWLQLGDEEAADNRRFALRLPDAQGAAVDRWTLGREGDSTLRGRVRLAPAYTSPLEGDGHLRLQGTAPAQGFGGGVQWDALAATPETARAWQLYRTAVDIQQATQTFQADQLRIETFHPGEEGDPARAAWVAGLLGGEDAQVPVATGNASQHLAVRALGGGAWGNRVFVRIDPVTGATFDLTVLYYAQMPPLPLVDPTDPANALHPDRREPEALEYHEDLDIAPGGERHCLTMVNAASQLVRLAWDNPAVAPSLPVTTAFTPLAGGADGEFGALLTVRSDGAVIIEGDLQVEGQIIEGAIPADVEDERFRDELLGRWTKGLTLAGTEVDAYYELPLDVAVNITSTAGGQVSYDVTISHVGGGSSREVPIISVLSEFRNDQRLLVHTENLPLAMPNPLNPGQTMDLSATTPLNITGAVTLTVRVFSLGVAQNAVEKSATAVFNL